MRVLVLDDDQARHRRFREWLIGTVADHVYTSKQALAALDEHSPYDVVFLDHDLDENAVLGLPEGETAQCVAEYIALHLPLDRRPRFVIVHSHNKWGARRMAAALAGAHVPVITYPFGAKLGLVMASVLRTLKRSG